jgi:hypothetical protein
VSEGALEVVERKVTQAERTPVDKNKLSIPHPRLPISALQATTHAKMLSIFQIIRNRSKMSGLTSSWRFGAGLGGSGGTSVRTRRRTRPSWMDMGSRSRSSMGYLMGLLLSFSLALPAFCASTPGEKLVRLSQRLI